MDHDNDVGHLVLKTRLQSILSNAPRVAALEVVLSRQLQPGDEAWEQASSRISCPGCGKRFGFLNRRHHCRCMETSFSCCYVVS